MSRRVLVSVVCFACAAMACSAAVAAGLPTALVSDGHGYRVKPASIYDTGDGSGVLGTLHGRGGLDWKAWTGTSALGVGTYWVKLGTPVATSPFTRLGVSVLLTRVRDGHFTRMNLRYRQQGRNANVTLCVPDSQRVLEWGTLLKGRCFN